MTPGAAQSLQRSGPCRPPCCPSHRWSPARRAVDRSSLDPQTARASSLGYSDGMSGLVRTVLIWLLVLALPAQGAAAATMAFCNPEHHAAGGTAASPQIAMAEPVLATQQHGHAHAGAQDLAPHSHSQVAQQGLGDGGPAVRSANSDTASGAVVSAGDLSAATPAHNDNHKCSACASCCSAAVVGSTVLNVPAPGVTPTVFISVVPTVERFSSGGPDRPPRVLVV